MRTIRFIIIQPKLIMTLATLIFIFVIKSIEAGAQLPPPPPPPPPPPGCTTDVECDDGLFCNGRETCQSGTCVAGASPCPSGECNEEQDICTDDECPVTLALQGSAHERTALTLLRDFRDQVLAASPEGERYTQLFYTHAGEVSWLLLGDPVLRSQSGALINHFLPAVENLLVGSPATVTRADMRWINVFLDTLAAQASHELQDDIETVQEELWNGQVLERFGIVIR